MKVFCRINIGFTWDGSPNNVEGISVFLDGVIVTHCTSGMTELNHKTSILEKYTTKAAVANQTIRIGGDISAMLGKIVELYCLVVIKS